MLEHLKKWWPTHVSWIAGLFLFIDPSVKDWLGQPSHVKYAAIGATVWAIILHNLTAPKNADLVADVKDVAKTGGIVQVPKGSTP